MLEQSCDWRMNTSPPERAKPTRRKRAQNTAPSGVVRHRADSASTLSDVQYERLHAAIISMDIVPGTAISEKNIALEQGISRTPIREAILRLARENLVEVVSKSGTFVARIPISALPEALIARRALEGMTVRSAARSASRSQILELQALIERQREMMGRDDIKGFHLVDDDYHAKIASIGKLPGLWRLVQQVKLQVDRFRHMTLPEEGRMAMVIDEHAAVVTAIEQGDEKLACANMEIHLSGLQHHFAYWIEINPDYFIHDIDLNDIAQV
ncbi:MAG: GntR family transcriptional regulator [Hyphomicrobiales bacterium]|nr:GntR family transcriptional regulator [Hyphomicrobiales bacterium]PCJ94713.1 MAG: GntR family transcriptional regulator [Hyphomicrobiales bacterium]